jgi:hypothetical protein
MEKWVTDSKKLVSFKSNGSKVTQLLFKSNLPTTGFRIYKMIGLMAKYFGSGTN